MIHKIKDIWDRVVIRPMIYMTFTRLGVGLLASLLLNHFFRDNIRNMLMYAFTFFTALFAVMAWIAYLRLDGMHLPKLFMMRLHPKKKPFKTYGDISDHIDDEIVPFEKLTSPEKDLCCLVADFFCFAVFLILALVTQ